MGGLSLKLKVLLGVTLTSISAIIVLSIVLVSGDVSRQHEAITKDSVTLAKIVGASTAGAMAFGDTASAGATLLSLENSPRVSSAVIFDESGKPFVWYT